MKIVENQYWIYYISESGAKNLDNEKCGKWMYFSKDVKFASEICKKAIENGIVVEAKHSKNLRDKRCVCCFYLNGDDVEGHRKTIQFFLDNNLIQKTIDGKLYNIAFKFDTQTMNREYGDDFIAKITLDKFIDLKTCKWKI